jgi:glycerol-3-phosphate dehydrogenase subunit C
MGEGSLEAPERRPIPWRDTAYYDVEDLDAELRRVFDICHGCRRCFNLCDSFPRLFDTIDESETGELDSVSSAAFKAVADACTLCDMCFRTKCPYVPPHEFDLDFPHLMVRYRALEARLGKIGVAVHQLTKTDRNGRLGCAMPGLVNWASKRSNALTRPVLEGVAGVHRDAELPCYHSRTLVTRAAAGAPAVNREAPAFGRKAVIYATCFANYNCPDIGLAGRAVLARNGVETEVVHPACCGMPQFENGDIAAAAAAAARVAAKLVGWIDKGYDVVSLVPSCSLMLKFEWPLIVPDNADVGRLSGATRDIAEYVVDIAKTEGLADGMSTLDGGVTVHIACHARAQNMGQKAAEMLRLLPDTKLTVIERCSGHGGSWGVMKDNFEVALKVGRLVAKSAAEAGNAYLVSECPLARQHIVQGLERLGENTGRLHHAVHPVELMARAYGL